MIDVVVDLSHQNGDVKSVAAKADSIVGVIHNATHGVGYTDPPYTLTWGKAQAAGPRPQETEALLRKTCQREGVAVEEPQRAGRRGRLSAIRALLPRALVAGLGLSLAQMARHLGVSTPAISKILRKTNA